VCSNLTRFTILNVLRTISFVHFFYLPEKVNDNSENHLCKQYKLNKFFRLFGWKIIYIAECHLFYVTFFLEITNKKQATTYLIFDYFSYVTITFSQWINLYDLCQ